MSNPLHNLPLESLKPHPNNSNAMPKALLKKLTEHIQRSERYPPLIVRPYQDAYQLIDGHHRAEALRSLGHRRAQCVVWDVDDDDTLLLLATLNRLEGRDDPQRRADLLRELSGRMDQAELPKLLPEDSLKLQRYLSLTEILPPAEPPTPLADLPVSVHFFLLPNDKTRLEQVLSNLHEDRGKALMMLIDQAQNTQE